MLKAGFLYLGTIDIGAGYFPVVGLPCALWDIKQHP